MIKAIVDTHALIWLLEKNPRLGRRASEILHEPGNQLVIPVIVLCEFYYYLRKKKGEDLYIGIYEKLKTDPRVVFAGLEAELVQKIPPGLEMHDGIIAAIQLSTEGSVILSKDEEFLKWNKNVLVWK